MAQDLIDGCNAMVRYGEKGDWMPAIMLDGGTFADPKGLKIAKPDWFAKMSPADIRENLRRSGRTTIDMGALGKG